MAVNYATNYQQALQEVYRAGLMFGDLYNTANNSMIKWTGAKTIMIPSITVGGFTDVNRDVVTGFTRRVDNQFTTLTLEHDREFQTLVDPMDIDETNMALSIANITRTFNTEHKIPEMDKYMASKLLAEFLEGGGEVDNTPLTVDNVLTVFDQFMEEMDEAEVPTEGRILYVTPKFNTLLKNAEKVQRVIDTRSNSGAGNASRNVRALDEVTIKVVSSNRMKTVYNFTDGAVVDPSAQQINMLLIHPTALFSPQKYDFVSLDEPTAKSGGKWLYYERKYWDVFVVQKKIPGIKFNVTAPAEAPTGE